MLTSNTSLNTRIILRGQEAIHRNKLASEKKIILYRVLQELIINIKKYNGAKLVAISLENTGNYLELTCSDKGNGCTNNDLRNGNMNQIMENRIFSIGGDITFEAEKGKGLRAVLKFQFKYV